MNNVLKKFVEEVRAVYAPVVTGPASRLDRGEILWGQFEIAVAACESGTSDSARVLTERVNEMIVAKILTDDPHISERIAYEPDFLPHGRRIDFFTSCNDEKCFAWNRSDLEDFADFYRSGSHRPDDVLASMEQCYIEDRDIQLRRNIDHFAGLIRPVECALPTGFVCPVAGPRLASPGSLSI